MEIEGMFGIWVHRKSPLRWGNSQIVGCYFWRCGVKLTNQAKSPREQVYDHDSFRALVNGRWQSIQRLSCSYCWRGRTNERHRDCTKVSAVGTSGVYWTSPSTQNYDLTGQWAMYSLAFGLESFEAFESGMISTITLGDFSLDSSYSFRIQRTIHALLYFTNGYHVRIRSIRLLIHIHIICRISQRDWKAMREHKPIR